MKGSRGRRTGPVYSHQAVTVPGRCPLRINPVRTGQAPGPVTPAGGVIQGLWGGGFYQESFCSSAWIPSPPPPRFLQAMVAAVSLTRTWQPLLPTCRGMLPSESPASASCRRHGLPCRSAPRPPFWMGELRVQVGYSQPPSQTPPCALTHLSPVETIRAPGDMPGLARKAPRWEWESERAE